MSVKRGVARGVLGAATIIWGRPAPLPADPESIFVLRNNDIGDTIVITPLFDALRRLFPRARVVAGVGPWSAPVLEHNPHLSGWLPVAAPWHNKARPRATLAGQLGYVLWSGEARAIRRERFAVGIDVLGSPQGSLLLMRAGIRSRLGVRGYAGGHEVTSAWVEYDERRHVARAALGFAELLGARDLPLPVPQLFLTGAEREAAESRWRVARRSPGAPARRIVLAPGAGLREKRWPANRFVGLARRLGCIGACEIVVLGGPEDRAIGQRLAEVSASVTDLTGAANLRQTFAAVATADAVVTSPSMPTHVAAAFGTPAVVALGPLFPSVERYERQWGYPATECTIGHEATEEDALAALSTVIARQDAAARPAR